MSVYRPRNKDGSFKSAIYLYDFQHAGVRFAGSTGETEERRAKAVEREKRKEADAEIEAGKKIDRTSLDQVFLRFWDERGQHDKAAATTLARIGRLQSGLTEILRQRGRPLTIGSIDDDNLAAYVARRRGQKSRHNKLPAPATINREIQILRRIMRRASRTWKMPMQLPDWGELLFDEPEERIVDVAENLEARILEALRPDFRPAVRFLVLSGMRLGNALMLHPDQVDFQNDILLLKLKSKKPGGRTQLLPITRAMKLVLANELAYEHPEFVFTFEARRTSKKYVRGQRYPIHPEALYRAFKAAAAACGRPELRLHDLRHTAGTRTLRRTNNLRLAQNQLGHTRVSTTEKYAHVLMDDLRAGMEDAHSPGESPEIIEEEDAKPLSA